MTQIIYAAESHAVQPTGMSHSHRSNGGPGGVGARRALPAVSARGYFRLAGAISVLAAIASKGFVAAHNRLGRNRPIG